MKTGDIVKCITPDTDIVVGDFYSIYRKADYFAKDVVYLTPDGPPYFANYFEIIDLKEGDRVVAIRSGIDLITGETYRITKPPHLLHRELRITIIDNKEEYSYPARWFEKVVSNEKSIDELIKLAKSYIGKNVEVNGDRFSVYDIEVTVTKGKARSSSGLVAEYFEKHGFCVAVLGGYFTIPVDQVTLVKDFIEVPLNDNFTAEVYKDTIVVGCQTFPITILDELVKAHKKH